MVTKSLQDGNSESFQQQKDGQANTQRLKSAIDQANNKMKQVRTRFEYSYHEETNRISIKVIDKETQEIIREIPQEESLEMLEKIWEIAGILVDEKR
ncbi:MAG: flagellar protein FlaG protein [Anaerocolumna sp.]|nr:flagellar protein FlaG protein [Anaerocolumna sp.]